MNAEVRALAERSAKTCTNGSGQWRRGVCQACLVRTGKADRRGSFSFNTATGWYQCFKCAVVGRVAGYDKNDVEEVVEEEKPVMEVPEGFYELTRGEGKKAMSLDRARNYLRSRGLTNEELWHEAHLGACIEGYFNGRVVVPMLSPDGIWMGFVARAWKKKHPIPYLYPKGMARRDALYNHAALLRDTDVPVFVVEGVMDSLALWPDAVAILGKPSDPQVWALAECKRPVAVCLDGDAWEEGETLAMRLRLEGQRAGNIVLPPTLDPDEVEVQWLREEARRVLE